MAAFMRRADESPVSKDSSDTLGIPNQLGRNIGQYVLGEKVHTGKGWGKNE
jgi:hypothetical protein